MLQGGQYYEGGDDYEDLKYEDAIQLYAEDGWTTVARMNVPRSNHAVSVVNSDDVVC